MTAESDAAGVEADLNYLVPGSRVNRRYVAPGAEINTGQYEPRRVKIRNARPFENRLGFDSHGFVLAAWRTPHTSFHDFTYPNACVRRSIEFRTVAYFEP